MRYFIYQIINLINGKIYVGQTNDLQRRWKEHRRDALNYKRQKSVLHKAIHKYGITNFDFRTLQEVFSFEEALSCEIYWINFFKSNVIRYGKEFGYNLSDGGDGSGHGPKSKTHKENIGISNTGKIRTEEMKLSLSKKKSSFTIEQLTEIKQLIINDIPQDIIAKKYKVAQSIISDIKIGKSHRYFFTDNDIEIFNQHIYNRSGEKNNGAKLKVSQVKEIKILLQNKTPISIIAKQYNIGKTSVRRIQSGETWINI